MRKKPINPIKDTKVFNKPYGTRIAFGVAGDITSIPTNRTDLRSEIAVEISKLTDIYSISAKLQEKINKTDVRFFGNSRLRAGLIQIRTKIEGIINTTENKIREEKRQEELKINYETYKKDDQLVDQLIKEVYNKKSSSAATDTLKAIIEEFNDINQFINKSSDGETPEIEMNQEIVNLLTPLLKSKDTDAIQRIQGLIALRFSQLFQLMTQALGEASETLKLPPNQPAFAKNLTSQYDTPSKREEVLNNLIDALKETKFNSTMTKANQKLAVYATQLYEALKEDTTISPDDAAWVVGKIISLTYNTTSKENLEETQNVMNAMTLS